MALDENDLGVLLAAVLGGTAGVLHVLSALEACVCDVEADLSATCGGGQLAARRQKVAL